MTTTNNIPRDGRLNSPWQKGILIPGDDKKKVRPENTYDCLIVGGGITGLTAAVLLQNEGYNTIVADANTIGFGTTGGTSAHINTFADTNYKEAASAFGEEGAKLFAEAINEGFDLIRSNIDKYKIDCDFETKPGFVYAETDKELSFLEDMFEGAVKVGVPVEYIEDVPTPVKYIKALKWDGQAQFHPVKYLKGLQEAYIAAGGVIAENTLVEGVTNEDGVLIAKTSENAYRARNVIYATHMPPNINVINFEAAPYRSYVVAVKLKSDAYPDALVYDCQEPYHYIRTHVIDGEKLLLVGGADHKTGHGDPEKAFADLEEYIRKYYDVASVEYQWSSQYYIPADGFPYIGQLPFAADGIFCASGYNGNGMMLGSIAGKILSDLVSKRSSKYEKAFSPARIKPIDSFTEFVKENADVAYRFVADRFNVDEIDTLKDLPNDTGKVVEVDGKKVAAYRDEQGKIHVLNPVCTHAGCIVAWNGEEKSWDCPCHGARYDINGKVLTGPTTRDLPAINIA